MLGSGSQVTKMNLKNKLSLKRSNSNSTQPLNLNKLGCSENNIERSNSWGEPSSRSNSEYSNENVDKSLIDFKSPKKDDVREKKSGEDSLVDFKSPKEEKKIKPIFDKFKFEKEKTKKKLVKPKSKSAKPVDKKQKSIESSFFKPQSSDIENNIKESFPCPLCLKPFKDDLTCTNHMKICATKNKVSLKQLLDAKKLQERQAEERKALGLLAAPVIPEKKKTFRSKNYTTEDDPQLQLVLAMSESLYEAEQQNEFEQAAVLAGVPAECVKDINAVERRKTLQSFGFSTNKPLIEAPVKQTKKRKFRGPTILETRSKEDKDRVLTERIACIITGEDALTQAQQFASSSTQRERISTLLRSRKLRSIQVLDNKLWDLSRLTRKQNDFYVEELKSHFFKIVEKPLDDDEPFTNSEIPKEENVQESLGNTSIEYEPVDIELLVDQNKDSVSLDIDNLKASNSNETEEMASDIDFIKKTSSNWCQALNSSARSDIIIFVKNNKEIYAHQLVFFVQWPSILHSMEINDSLRGSKIKNKISWLTKDQISALAFLEFIYCGYISKNDQVFDQKHLLTEVEQLAKQYRVQQLIDYIQMKNSEKSKKSKDHKTSKHRSRRRHSASGDSNDSSKQSYDGCTDQFLSDMNDSYVENFSTHTSPQFKSPLPVKKISYQNYKETQGLPFVHSNVHHNLNPSNISKCSRETQTDDIIDCRSKISFPNYNSLNKHNLEIQPTENLEKTKETVAARPYTKNFEPYTQPETNAIIEPIKLNIGSVINTPIRFVPASCKTNHRRFTNSPELFDSLSESMLETSNKRNESNSSQNNTILNVLVDLANEDNVTEISKVQDSPDDCEIINLPKPVFNSSSNTKENSLKEPDEKEVIALESDDSDDEHSIHNAVTPPRNHSKEKDYDTVINQDSFLNKVRKINAKDDLESDSDADISIPTGMRRNPFLIRNRDDSYRYLKNNDKNETNRKVISMLERDVSMAEKLQNPLSKELSRNKETSDQSTKKRPSVDICEDFEESDLVIIDEPKLGKSVNETSLNNNKEGCDNLSSNSSSTVDESEMSMYSRYKRQNNHNNSIQNYRRGLDFDSKKNYLQQKNDNSTDLESERSSVNNLKTGLTINREASKVQDVTLVYDSDDERPNISEIEPEKNPQNRDSNYSLTPDKNKLNSSRSRVEHANLSSFDLADEEISKIINSPGKKNDSFIDLCNDSDEENEHEKSSQEPIILKNITTRKKESSSNKLNTDKDECTKQHNEKNSSSIHDREIEEISNDPKKSSSENFSTNRSNESNKSKDLNKTNDIDFGSLDNEWLNDFEHEWNAEVPPNKASDVISDKTNVSAKKSTSKSDSLKSPPASPSPNNKISKKKVPEFSKCDSPQSPSAELRGASNSDTLEAWKDQNTFSKFDTPHSPPASPTRHGQPSNHNFSKFDLPRSSSASQKSPLKNKVFELDSSQFPPASPSENVRTSYIPSPVLSQNKKRSRVRKLQTKSVSTSNFETPPKKKAVKKCHEYEDALKDLSSFETPQLHRELKKFGLKPQNRKNAKLLLTHVYTGLAKQKNENLQPEKRALNEDSLSESEEPPPKKQNLKGISQKGSSKENAKSKPKKKSTDTRAVIAEETFYDEPDAALTVKDSVSIKDAFNQLIKNDKKLHNKILTYEPLPLEHLHSSLKEKGFKCDKNILMDFLDEQCITFQVLTGKNVDRRKRKK